MMNSFNGYIAGGYLRRVIQSGDAFQFQNADLDFWFPTSNDLFGAVNFVNQGNLTQFNQPDVQEISVDSSGNVQVDLVSAAVTNAGTFAVQADLGSNNDINIDSPQVGKNQLDNIGLDFLYKSKEDTLNKLLG